MVYEKSEDSGVTWKQVSKEKVESALNLAYIDGGLMMANMIAGLVVVTPYGKYRIQSKKLKEDSI